MDLKKKDEKCLCIMLAKAHEWVILNAVSKEITLKRR
jgi:hypothetical protein